MFEPFVCRMTRGFGIDLNDVAIFEMRIKRDEFTVHFCTGHVVADVGMYRIGKVDRT